MVLTPSRYLNWFQSYYSLNIDKHTTMTTCVVMIAQYITFSMTTCVLMIAVNWLSFELLTLCHPSGFAKLQFWID